MANKNNKNKSNNNSSNLLVFGRWPQTKIMMKCFDGFQLDCFTQGLKISKCQLFLRRSASGYVSWKVLILTSGSDRALKIRKQSYKNCSVK